MKASYLLISASSALTIILAAPDAMAQDESDQSNAVTQIDTIVVTAQRREENLQRVPVAVTAFVAEKLETMTLRDTSDLGNQTPGLQVTPSGGGSPLSPRVAMRGQFQNAINITNDPSVALYIDDIYIGKNTGAVFDFFDVARVEVLKGPQGTLFGRNSTGGAVRYVSNRPDLDMIEGSVRIGVGNYNERMVQGVLNVPLSDTLAVRFGGSYREHDGHTTTFLGTVNPLTGAIDIAEERDTNDLESLTLKASIFAQPSDNFDFLISGLYSDKKNSGYLVYATGGDLSLLGAGDSQQHRADFFSGINSAVTPFGAPLDYGNTSETYIISGESNLYIDDAINAKLIVGYSETDFNNVFDVDGTVLPLVDSATFQDFKQFSAELQLNGVVLDDRIDYVLGAYYFTEKGRDVTDSNFLNPPFVVNNITDGFGKNDSISFFGHATLEVTDRLSAQGGLRWTNDSRSYISTNSQTLLNLSAMPPSIMMVCPLVPGPNIDSVECIQNQPDESFKFISYGAGLDYQFTDNIFGYIRTGRGQRSGGLQNRSITGTVPGFDEEVLTDYEVGLKLTFPEFLRLNFAYYFGDYKDIQQITQEAVFDGLGNQVGVTTIVSNRGGADIQGFELEGTIVLPAGFGLEGGISYTDVEFSAPDDIQFGVPKWTYNASLTYGQDVGPFVLSGRLDYYRRGTLNLALTQTSLNTNPALAPLPAFEQLNARIGIALENGLDIAFYAKNLNEDETFIDGLNLSENFIVGYLPQPRTYGLEIGYRF